MLTLTGRRKIYTSIKPDSDENVKEIIREAFIDHSYNQIDLDKLYEYYKGDHEIWDKTKTVRPDINNKIMRNLAYQIINFHTGNIFAQPIQYVQEVVEEGDTSVISSLNHVVRMAKKATRDRELGEAMLIGGVGYRIILPNNNGITPFITDVLDARRTFVVKSVEFGNRDVLGVTYYHVKNDRYKVYAYTERKVYTFDMEHGETPELKFMDVRPNGIGKIPIIEYPLNPSRIGQFEQVISLIDAINTIESNRTDGVQQFVQAFLKFKDCDVSDDDIQKLEELGAIRIKSTENGDADVSIVAEELNQTQTQVLIDNLYQAVITATSVPDRSVNTTGNTGQAIVVGQGWTDANNLAEAIELMFEESEYKFLDILLTILRNYQEYGWSREINPSDVGVKFTRSKTFNLLVKTQGLMNLLEAGIHPREAMQIVDLFADSEEVYKNSEEYLTKWKVLTGDKIDKPIEE